MSKLGLFATGFLICPCPFHGTALGACIVATHVFGGKILRKKKAKKAQAEHTSSDPNTGVSA